MVGDTHFLRYIPDSHPEELVAPEQIRRHILCTGQVYHYLLAEREARGIKDVVISRVEQISPFPYDLVRRIAAVCGILEYMLIDLCKIT